MRCTLALALALLLALPLSLASSTLELSDPVVLRAAAVAQTPTGLVGSTASITVTAAKGGAGHIFLDTFPLAEVDMQGSARLAVRVASQVTGISWRDHDFFFAVRSGSQQIGGPSAGGALTVGAIGALAGWKVREDALMTGTINPDGTIGPVGGIAEKVVGAKSAGVRLFLFPAGQPVITYQDTQVNLTDHCANVLQMTCEPVVDIIDAVNLMTDHRIERPPVPDNVTDEAYRAMLDPLSGRLRAAAAALVEEAAAAVAELSAENRTIWDPRVAIARDLLARADSAAANGTYYTSASLSFQTSIEAHTVRDSARIIEAPDSRAATNATLAQARVEVENARRLVVARVVSEAPDFETVGSAQIRLQDAETRLARAESILGNASGLMQVLEALRETSWASERALTATWWLELADQTQPGRPISRNDLEEVARDMIITARETVTYVTAVLRQQVDLSVLGVANQRLTDADAALARGFHAGAMLQAIEAEVRASSILEAATYGGGLPAAKFDTLQAEAARAIEAARARGSEPLLAQSQYEFGLTLEDPLEKMAFLSTARVTANLAGLPDTLEGSSPLESRFQKLPPLLIVPPNWLPAAFAIGLALGVGAGLSAMMPKERKREEGEARSARQAEKIEE